MSQNKIALLILGIITVIAVAGLTISYVQDNKSTGLSSYSQPKIYGGAIKKWNAQHSYVSYDIIFDEQGNIILPQKSTTR